VGKVVNHQQWGYPKPVCLCIIVESTVGCTYWYIIFYMLIISCAYIYIYTHSKDDTSLLLLLYIYYSTIYYFIYNIQGHSGIQFHDTMGIQTVGWDRMG